MNKEEKEVFWYKDLSVLINVKYIVNYFPSNEMNLDELLNSIVRLSMYISIIFVLIKRNPSFIFLFIFTLIITYLIYNNLSNEDKNKLENFNNFIDNNCEGKNIVKPTVDNPFMNVQLEDYENNVNRESENKCNLYNDNYDKIQGVVNDNFSGNLFQDAFDVYNNNNSQRQFYTMPNTSIPNDQTTFAKWCYQNPNTCKDGNTKDCYSQIPKTFGDSNIMGGNLRGV